MIYYTSDLHFNHSNIIRLCDRPFEDVKEMNEAIIKKWNEVVKSTDEVYILGDVGLPKNHKDKSEIISCLSRLKGRKHLIVGNHDKDMLKNDMFKWIFRSIESYMEIKDNGRKVILFHYPIHEWNGYYKDTIHLYGHTHEKTPNHDVKGRYNVGIDMHNRPVTLDEVISKYEE